MAWPVIKAVVRHQRSALHFKLSIVIQLDPSVSALPKPMLNGRIPSGLFQRLDGTRKLMTGQIEAFHDAQSRPRGVGRICIVADYVGCAFGGTTYELKGRKGAHFILRALYTGVS